MPTKRKYRRVSVNEVHVEKLLEIASLKGDVQTAVGLDVGKREIVAVIRWSDGSFEFPISIKNPSEVRGFVGLLLRLQECCGGLTIGLESTGTYGDSIRYWMTHEQLVVHRVSGKAASDYKEVFDGVSSKHDGKDAAVIAELTWLGKGASWPFTEAATSDEQMRVEIARLDAFQDEQTRWLNRLDAQLARHWPELTSILSLTSATFLQIMIHYGGPARLADDAEAETKLRRWGGARLGIVKTQAIIESAKSTNGIPMSELTVGWIQEMAKEAERCRLAVKQSRSTLKSLADADAELKPFVSFVGAVTLCTLRTTVGSPKDYQSSGAYLKALGLNLIELSSGQHSGNLRISKRGPALARKRLFFWAMRAVQKPGVRSWYFKYKKQKHTKIPSHLVLKGLTAVMRKLVRSYWYSCKHDLPFDYDKVFPGKPLQKRRRQRRRPVAVVS